MRIFFATDIHGSRGCWRKFLRCGEFYGADVLVLGGDMTGKGLVPVIRSGGSCYVHLHDQRSDFPAEELDAILEGIRDQGLYPFVIEEDELAALRDDAPRLDALFQEEVIRTVERWVKLADERLAGSNVRCFVCPGNDDMPEIDEILATSQRLEVAEGNVIDLAGGFAMVSTGWSNQTPWSTYREEPEDRLGERIARMTEQLGVPPERTVFNLHCPPYDTPLDEAPALTEDLKLVEAGRITKHVGSTAVRGAIEEVQPALALHGHIHESRGVSRLGQTLAINPGSSYEQGVLLGALVEINGKKKVKNYQLTSG